MVDELWFPVHFCQNCNWEEGKDGDPDPLVLIGGMAYCNEECYTAHRSDGWDLAEFGHWADGYRWNGSGFEESETEVAALKKSAIEGEIVGSGRCLPIRIGGLG